MDGKTGALYNRFTGLKNTNPGLKAYISVGGWSFTDPGPTRNAFSNMASSSANRGKFISGLMSFMNEYGFDGVDRDKANYVALVAQMRSAFGSKYGITVTLPTSFWYLQHFDLVGLQPNVDWFNLMSYDCKSYNTASGPCQLTYIFSCSAWYLGRSVESDRSLYCTTHQHHRNRPRLGFALASWCGPKKRCSRRRLGK
jgi:GH18 family chitinase